jgi:hypothetical protein
VAAVSLTASAAAVGSSGNKAEGYLQKSREPATALALKIAWTKASSQ